MDWHDLPEDLTIEIFARLPVKSLIRFKSINKAWRDYISSSRFANLHLDRNKNKPLSYITMTRTHIQLVTHDGECSVCNHRSYWDVDYRWYFLNDGHIAGSSSNGLVCFNHWGDDFRYIIWNPATMEFRYIPFARDLYDKKGENQQYGFGFDSRPCGDYKLVLIVFSDNGVERVEMYNSSSNCWKEISDNVTLTATEKVEDSKVVTLNGSIYWTMRKSFSNPIVACFDIWNEKLKRITGPSRFGPLGKLGVVNGKFLGMFYTEDSGNLEGWVMNPKNQSWTKRINVVSYSPSLNPKSAIKKVTILLDKDLFFYQPSTKRLGRFPKIADHLDVIHHKETLFRI